MRTRQSSAPWCWACKIWLCTLTPLVWHHVPIWISLCSVRYFRYKFLRGENLQCHQELNALLLQLPAWPATFRQLPWTLRTLQGCSAPQWKSRQSYTRTSSLRCCLELLEKSDGRRHIPIRWRSIYTTTEACLRYICRNTFAYLNEDWKFYTLVH